MNQRRRQFLVSCTGVLAGGTSLVAGRAATVVAPPDHGASEPRPLVLRAARLAAGADRLSYDGTPGGPVVRVPHGTTLAVTLTNGLDAPTALVWQGLRGVAAAPLADVPEALAPNATATWRLTPPDPGTYWFHAAPLPGLLDQTAAGLHGLLVVEEREPPAVDRDLPLVLSDAPEGGILVNAALAPLRDTVLARGRIRMRLLNASTARLMVVAVEGAQPRIVAVDGQPSSLFTPVRDSVPIGPGARFDLMMDAPREAGAAVRLRLRALLPTADAVTADVVLAELTTTGAPRSPRSAITALPLNPALPAIIPLERAVRADLVMEQVGAPKPGAARWRVNGAGSLALSPTPLLRVPHGTPVTLGLDNRGAVPVPLRVQGQVMRLLHAKDDGWEPYWRDGVVLPPASQTHVAFVPDTPGRWTIDSAVFGQGAFGLRSWFLVT